MERGGIDEEAPAPKHPQQRYRAVESHDHAVVPMASMEPGSSAAAPRIVGMGGVWQSLVLVAFCGACTFLTGLSLSAIATNGAMKGGGPYYLIGRALGPEVGVSIGLCFFLGNAVAGAINEMSAKEPET
nr:unnamed protein product [Digitaria exilis]